MTTTSISNYSTVPTLNARERLDAAIQITKATPAPYCLQNPLAFTRDRKLPFEKLIYFLMELGAKSVNSELCEFFLKEDDLPTDSALCQRRSQLDPSALLRVLYLFNKTHSNLKKFHGRHLLAFDGSAVNIPFDAQDPFTLITNGEKTYSQYHLNALYDSLNEIFYDVALDSPSKTREVKALMEILDRRNYPEHSIFIEDRGICSYELISKFQKMGLEFIIRSKDIHSACGMLSNLPLPADGEFDEDVSFTLTRKQTKEVKQRPEKYKYLHWGVEFSEMPKGGAEFYDMSFRVVRFEVEPDNYCTIITNLDRDEFPPAGFKELYHFRWREEVAFLELKYPVSMLHFHSKKRFKIQQEIYGRILMYDFCSVCRLEAQETIKELKTEMYDWKINFSVAVTNVRLLLVGRIDWEGFEKRIKKFLVPIRPGRKAQRHVKRQSVRPMYHRLA